MQMEPWAPCLASEKPALPCWERLPDRVRSNWARRACLLLGIVFPERPELVQVKLGFRGEESTKYQASQQSYPVDRGSRFAWDLGEEAFSGMQDFQCSDQGEMVTLVQNDLLPFTFSARKTAGTTVHCWKQ